MTGRQARHLWTRPLTAPWPVVQTFSAVGVLLAIAITLAVTSRIVAMVRILVGDETSTT
jgi:hypothetical protein